MRSESDSLPCGPSSALFMVLFLWYKGVRKPEIGADQAADIKPVVKKRVLRIETGRHRRKGGFEGRARRLDNCNCAHLLRPERRARHVREAVRGAGQKPGRAFGKKICFVDDV